MFISDAVHRHDLYSALFGDGVDCWRAVMVASNQPWFVVSLEALKSLDGSKHGGDAPGMVRCLLVGDVSDVLALLEQAPNSQSVARIVSVVVPKYDGDLLTWEMERVIAIWQPRDQKCDDPGLVSVYVIETLSGRLCPSHSSGEWVPRKTEMTLVCSIGC